MKIVASLLVLICSSAIFANTHVAKIIKLENPSDIYVPGQNKESTYKHIKYLDEVYHIVPAQIGMRLENGYILTTGPQSKAKIIFNNGDHFFVAENTQYKINWVEQEKVPTEETSIIYLIRGAIRGMVQKNGPRSGMKVKVTNAVMGVRGTDFFVTEKHGDMNVTVLRGEVEVVHPASNKLPIKVKTGDTLFTDHTTSNIKAMTKEDLQEIADSSSVKNTVVVKENSEQTKEFIELEKKATEITLNDIKEYQPQVYKEIAATKKESEMNSDALAINTVKIMEVHAPSRVKKPTESELSGSKDPYDQYKFKKGEE